MTDFSRSVKNNTDRMNQLVRYMFLSREEVHGKGNFRHMCRDHRRLTTCHKQHRQNESAGQVDIPARVEVRVMSHCLSKTTQTE